MAVNVDDEMAEEILRTYLLSKREMLAAALDYLGIAHVDGLTDSDDVAKFTKLKVSEIKSLSLALKAHASLDDVALYLKFMGTEGVDSALSGI
jgi:hypothetical protein